VAFTGEEVEERFPYLVSVYTHVTAGSVD
jgi:hypothetical protein